MEPTGERGQFRSDQAMPVDGLWKTILRLHRGAEMMAAPIYLPADPEIDEPAIPAVDRTVPFSSEKEFLLRETTDGNGWLSPVVHLSLAAVCALWAASFVVAVRHLAPTRPGGPPPQIGRASCRERVCQSVLISGVAVSLKTKTKK